MHAWLLPVLCRCRAVDAWHAGCCDGAPCAPQTLDLVAAAGPRIHSAGGWRILCSLITATRSVAGLGVILTLNLGPVPQFKLLLSNHPCEHASVHAS